MNTSLTAGDAYEQSACRRMRGVTGDYDDVPGNVNGTGVRSVKT